MKTYTVLQKGSRIVQIIPVEIVDIVEGKGFWVYTPDRVATYIPKNLLFDSFSEAEDYVEAELT